MARTPTPMAVRGRLGKAPTWGFRPYGSTSIHAGRVRAAEAQHYERPTSSRPQRPYGRRLLDRPRRPALPGIDSYVYEFVVQETSFRADLTEPFAGTPGGGPAGLDELPHLAEMVRAGAWPGVNYADAFERKIDCRRRREIANS